MGAAFQLCQHSLSRTTCGHTWRLPCRRLVLAAAPSISTTDPAGYTAASPVVRYFWEAAAHTLPPYCHPGLLIAGYTAASPVVRYFWEVVREMDKQELAQLVQFVTVSWL